MRTGIGRWTKQTLEEAFMLARLTRDLPGFLRTPITAQQAMRIVQRRLETRPERFVELVQRVIYQQPRSPYLQLLYAVGCERGDFEALVAHAGVEGALTSLSEHGVYVTFEEFKGLKEAVRGSARFTFAEEDFDNPGLSFHFSVRTGATRSRGGLVRTGLGFLADRAPADALVLQAHGLSEADHVIWRTRPVRPLLYAKIGRPPVAWYHTVKPVPLKVLATCWYLTAIGRLAGCPLPRAAFFDLQEPGQMALWLVAHVRKGRSICLSTRPSSAVRVALAAKQMGVALDGVCFFLSGEPYSETKRRLVEASGARAVVHYSVVEAGAIGYGCADPNAPDDLHFQADSYGLIQRARAIGDSRLSVDAFLMTSLLASAPKVLLNVESGDYGRLERRACRCQLGALGLQDHISHVRSFEKLTGEGMTFVKSHLTRVLEDVLPERFGGSSADYQLLEEEDRSGILRVYLLVSPAIGWIDEGKLKQAFLTELGRDGMLEAYMARTWECARTVEIKRRWPIVTKAGKVFPFHLAKNRRP